MYEGLSFDKTISNFSGISFITILNPSKTPEDSEIIFKAINETANPPKIKRTTWTTSVIATAFNPPDKEYAKEKKANIIKP